MRFFVILMALLALVGGVGYYYFQKHPEALPQQMQLRQLEDLKQRLEPSTDSPLTKFLHNVAPAKPAPATPPPPVNQVTLYLVNGGVVTGELVSETPQEVTLRFEYGDVGFRRAEIQHFVKGKEGTGDDHLTIPWEHVIPHPKAPADSSKDR